MIDLLLYAAVAGYMVFKLVDSFGKVSDQDYNSAAMEEEKMKIAQYQQVEPCKSDAQIIDHLTQEQKLKVEKNIIEIKKYNPEFSLENFFTGAEKAFEIIVKAFAEGDKKTLQILCALELFNKFSHEIDQRTNKLECAIIAILNKQVIDVSVLKQKAEISVKFKSEQSNVQKDQNNNIVAGSYQRTEIIEETWNFCKDLNSNSQKWLLESVT